MASKVRQRQAVFTLLMLIILLLAACSRPASEATTPEAAAPQAGAPAAAQAPGAQPSDMTAIYGLPDLKGRTCRGRGQRLYPLELC